MLILSGELDEEGREEKGLFFIPCIFRLKKYSMATEALRIRNMKHA